jgi:hypothetical protein
LQLVCKILYLGGSQDEHKKEKKLQNDSIGSCIDWNPFDQSNDAGNGKLLLFQPSTNSIQQCIMQKMVM